MHSSLCSCSCSTRAFVLLAMALSFSITATLLPQHQVKVSEKENKCLSSVRNLVREIEVPSMVSSPEKSLHNGNWVKLICGASFEDVVDVRNLSLVYTLAGVDCIDCAADESVVNAVNQEFDPEDCPLDCSRPCENVCPANAISFQDENAAFVSSDNVLKGGVVTERCYGCGRCFPICPYDRIREVTYVRDATATAELLKRNDVDAVEIHTSGRHISPFKELWDGLGNSVEYLKLVAVSLPYFGDSTVSSMTNMYSVMEPQLNCLNLWQLDGRAMSGDIGRGATRESIAFAARLAAAKNKPHGFLQLAGGTNAHTVEGLKRAGLFRVRSQSDPLEALIGGIAYGGYARKIVGRVLRSMQLEHGVACIEDHPDHLLKALIEALKLKRKTFFCRNLSKISSE
ncbi:uncharacterized protein [Euphorbia lathyris]|uniref:uncharacterized protein isoform X2 n=1 Tax=Euphorbia lathyris TaxID=212925 RepID=UPI00331359B1